MGRFTITTEYLEEVFPAFKQLSDLEAKRQIDLANALVGWVKGGMAYVTLIASACVYYFRNADGNFGDQTLCGWGCGRRDSVRFLYGGRTP